jgi:hypothetical protein
VTPGGAFYRGASLGDQRRRQGGGACDPASLGHRVGEHLVKEAGVVLTPGNHVRDAR